MDDEMDGWMESFMTSFNISNVNVHNESKIMIGNNFVKNYKVVIK
jgi:hypothetical protein